MAIGTLFGLVVASYLVGCASAGYYWIRWRTGQDIRSIGSGNAGARNVGRVFGKMGFVVTLLLDATKGALVVLVATYLQAPAWGILACMLAVAVGHTWPVQLHFRGGKGVSVTLGALLAYNPLIILGLAAIFLVALVLLRNFTLGGMSAFVLLPFAVHFAGLGGESVVIATCLSALVVFTHRRNIREESVLLIREKAGTRDA